MIVANDVEHEVWLSGGEQDEKTATARGSPSETLKGGGVMVSPAHDPRSHLLSVIVPARDEAGAIHALIADIASCVPEFPHEIIVVDDGSRDGTREIARQDGVVVVSHEQSLGKGAAMKTGVREARGDLLVFLDGDGAHDPRDIPKVIGPLLDGSAGLVIGSRCLAGSGTSSSSIIRKLTNCLASLVISTIVSFVLPMVTLLRCPLRHTRITDTTSGFRAVGKDGWNTLSLVSQGFEIETEMIYEAARNGITISEVPIGPVWNGRFSHLSITKDSLSTLGLLLRKLVGDFGRRQSTGRLSNA